MNKVEFTHNNGRKQMMAEKYAKILSGLHRGEYCTRDMRAAELKPSIDLSKPSLDKPKASKAAIALAESVGVDISAVTGSGEGGAITKPDVQAFIEEQNKAQD